MRLAFGSSEELPGEFRVFVSGWNDTSKGKFLFDAEAAKAVMAEYEKHGADMMLDLEHLSLENPTESRNFDPDARGWCKLELRNGELWATDVRWNPDGAARLTEKRQRYISPAFDADKKTRRIAELVNIAITSLPATHGLEPLVAATERMTMADESAVDIAKVAEGMGLDLASIAKALGLDAGAALEDLAASVDALGSKLKAIAGLGSAPAAAPEGEPPPEAANQMQDEEQKEMRALRANVLRETNAATSMQALSQIATWKTSHLELEAERAKLSKERLALEASERKELCSELVKIGKETPHTSGLAYGRIAKHLADMPLVELRERVASFKRLSKSPPDGPPDLPATNRTVMVGAVAVELSEEEVRRCKSRNADLNVYAEIKLRQGITAPVMLEGR